jgi:hypothetical protein
MRAKCIRQFSTQISRTPPQSEAIIVNTMRLMGLIVSSLLVKGRPLPSFVVLELMPSNNSAKGVRRSVLKVE